MKANKNTHETTMMTKLGSMFQVYNPVTGNYILRDGISGKLVQISHGKPFKGVKKEVPKISAARLDISRRVALKAERAVIAFVNGEL
jgi:hypothetical protein